MSGTEIRDPAPSPSEWHQLTLQFGPSGTSLAIDGREVWSGIPLEFLKRVRFRRDTLGRPTRWRDWSSAEYAFRGVIHPDPEIVAAENEAA